MITKYFQSVKVRMPAAGRSAKIARVFLAQLPPRQRADIKLDYKLLTESAQEPASIKVTFKDGTQLDVDPSRVASGEMVETFDRYSRKLQVNDSLKE